MFLTWRLNLQVIKIYQKPTISISHTMASEMVGKMAGKFKKEKPIIANL